MIAKIVHDIKAGAKLISAGLAKCEYFLTFDQALIYNTIVCGKLCPPAGGPFIFLTGEELRKHASDLSAQEEAA